MTDLRSRLVHADRCDCSAGAAGNFLASINQLSANAFKSVIDIDVLGSYNTLKATLPYLIESGKKHRIDSKTRMPLLSLSRPLGVGLELIHTIY